MQCLLGRHLSTAAKQVFKVGDEPPWEPGAGVAGDIDEQIDITLRAVPRATEPKTRTFVAPCRAAMRRISSRCSLTAS
jgi:hypothetical protein